MRAMTPRPDLTNQTTTADTKRAASEFENQASTKQPLKSVLTHAQGLLVGSAGPLIKEPMFLM